MSDLGLFWVGALLLLCGLLTALRTTHRAAAEGRTSEIDAILLILAVIQIVAGAATWGAAL